MTKLERPVRQEDIAVRILDKHADVIEAALTSRFPRVRVSREPLPGAAPFRVLISFRPPADEKLDQYHWVHSTGAGVDAICAGLTETSEPPVITRTTGRMGEQIAEYCLAYALGFLQRKALRDELQAARIWGKGEAAPRFLFGSKVAIIGTGDIGAAIGRAFAALGAEVAGYSRSGKAVAGLGKVRTLKNADGLSGMDVVILALPSTAATEGLVSDELLSGLSGTLLINIGRGSTLDTKALRRALEEGKVSRAVLDVFEEEPLPHDDWRWAHPQVTVTPHVAGLTLPDDAVNRFCELLEDFLETGNLPPSLDPDRGY
ncbi:MAG: NAD(P)-dependent oxidoreductase [Henriciella sp.]|uniref:NAD(P)-dependent oxidoreductase n=1 Tax=Henriciella sp. TaxID=1968823 RepID=UPI003C7798D9